MLVKFSNHIPHLVVGTLLLPDRESAKIHSNQANPIIRGPNQSLTSPTGMHNSLPLLNPNYSIGNVHPCGGLRGRKGDRRRGKSVEERLGITAVPAVRELRESIQAFGCAGGRPAIAGRGDVGAEPVGGKVMRGRAAGDRMDRSSNSQTGAETQTAEPADCWRSDKPRPAIASGNRRTVAGVLPGRAGGERGLPVPARYWLESCVKYITRIDNG